jgi:hypothetical protein
MAIKHVVTDGLGFTVPSYLLTDGLGDFSDTPPVVGETGDEDRRRSSSVLKWRLRRFAILFVLIPAALGVL